MSGPEDRGPLPRRLQLPLVQMMDGRACLPHPAVTLFVVVLLGLGLVLGQLTLRGPSRSDPAGGGGHQDDDRSPTGRFVLGSFDNPILRLDRSSPAPRIDIGATLAALKLARINTYAYLICPDQTANPHTSSAQLEQLPEFAQAAGAVGIDVLVTLVPPTEAPEDAYQPYGWDYVGWFDHIGRLAAEQPAIKGIVMDDFGGNIITRPNLSFHFTPSYVRTMNAAARTHAPGLAFLPVLYHHDLIGRSAILSDFRQYFQGVIFPYFGYSDGRTIPGNTRDATMALSQGIEVSDTLGCPDPGGCTQIVLPQRSAVDATVDTAVWRGSVTPRPNERRLLTIQIEDDAGTVNRSAYSIAASVDGTTVSTVSRGAGWNERIFDLTEATTRHSTAAVELRIVRAAGTIRNRVTLQIGEVTARGMSSDPEWTAPPILSSGLTTAPAAALPLIYTPYAVPLTAERRQGASPAYFASVLQQIGVLRAQGRIAGCLVFKLPLSRSASGEPDPRYAILENTYASWTPR